MTKIFKCYVFINTYSSIAGFTNWQFKKNVCCSFKPSQVYKKVKFKQLLVNSRTQMIICLHGLFHMLFLWTRKVINLWLTKIIQCQSFGIKIRLVLFFQFVVFDYSYIYIWFGVCLLDSVSLASYEGNFQSIKADTSNSMLLYRSGANVISPPK